LTDNTARSSPDRRRIASCIRPGYLELIDIAGIDLTEFRVTVSGWIPTVKWPVFVANFFIEHWSHAAAAQ
jgi:hypothetical protein